MFERVVFGLLTLFVYRVSCQGECQDVRGRAISHGLHYVPGPDTCTLCVCDNGQAKFCKAVLCSPPQDCRSFRVGNTCCEFICLDDVVKPSSEAQESILGRVMGGAALIFFLIFGAVLLYKMHINKPHQAFSTEDQSLNSIGYISTTMGCGSCEPALSSWKPPSNYPMPQGEAPPPYDEVVAQSRGEIMRIIELPGCHRAFSGAMDVMRSNDNGECPAYNLMNMSRHVPQMPNPSHCFNAPLLAPRHVACGDASPAAMPRRLIAHSVSGMPRLVRLSGSLGAISARGLAGGAGGPGVAAGAEPERPHNVPGFYSSPPPPPLATDRTDIHRTIPRISTIIDNPIMDGLSSFTRDRSLQNEIRRSFHKPKESPRQSLITDSVTGRSMPRNLNLSSNTDSNRPIDLPTDPPPRRSRAHSEEQNVSNESSSKLAPSTSKVQSQSQQEGGISAPQTLPLTVDKPSCVCSYEGGAAAAAEGEEADDYRNECANCHSATSSIWVLAEGGWAAESAEGTQTLQRRAPPAAPPPPQHATLPQPVAKASRSAAMGTQSSNWDNWFSAIPDSDTESE